MEEILEGLPKSGTPITVVVIDAEIPEAKALEQTKFVSCATDAFTMEYLQSLLEAPASEAGKTETSGAAPQRGLTRSSTDQQKLAGIHISAPEIYVLRDAQESFASSRHVPLPDSGLYSTWAIAIKRTSFQCLSL